MRELRESLARTMESELVLTVLQLKSVIRLLSYAWLQTLTLLASNFFKCLIFEGQIGWSSVGVGLSML